MVEVGSPVEIQELIELDSLDFGFDIEEAYPLAAECEYVYAVFVQATKQHVVTKEMPNFFPCRAMNPILIKRKWTSGGYKEVKYSLMPGYIFLFSNERMEPARLWNLDGVLKVLQYDDGAYALTEDDERLARWLARYDGTIGISKAIREGSQIQVVEGPMKDSIGKVLKIDKRKQCAKVEFQFNDAAFYVWMNFDWVESK